MGWFIYVLASFQGVSLTIKLAKLESCRFEKKKTLYNKLVNCVWVENTNYFCLVRMPRIIVKYLNRQKNS